MAYIWPSAAFFWQALLSRPALPGVPLTCRASFIATALRGRVRLSAAKLRFSASILNAFALTLRGASFSQGAFESSQSKRTGPQTPAPPVRHDVANPAWTWMSVRRASLQTPTRLRPCFRESLFVLSRRSEIRLCRMKSLAAFGFALKGESKRARKKANSACALSPRIASSSGRRM